MKKFFADPEIIKMVRERTRIGAEALYDQYASSLYKTICCRVTDTTSAELVLKETFLKVWNNINLHQPENGRLLLWMTGIARNLAIASAPSSVIDDNAEPTIIALR